MSKYETMLTPARGANIITDAEAMVLNAQLLGIAT
jgi:hypothetical protein